MFLYNILSMKFCWVRLSPFSLSSKPCTRFRRLWCRDILRERKRCRGWVSTEMHFKNLSSALSHRSSKLVKSPGQNPASMLRLMNAFIRPLTSALAKPHQACEAYVSLAITDARKIVCWFFSFIPLARRIRRAYSRCPDDAITSDTWSAMEKLLVSVTPRFFRVETLVNRGTSCVARFRGFRKIISYRTGDPPIHGPEP